MFRSVRKFSVFFLFMILSFSMASVSFAASDSENSVTGFFRKLFHYPVKATQETAGMTANTLQNTGEKVIAPVVSDPGRSVTGTLETVGQTVSETVQIPVKAAEEEKAQ